MNKKKTLKSDLVRSVLGKKQKTSIKRIEKIEKRKILSKTSN